MERIKKVIAEKVTEQVAEDIKIKVLALIKTCDEISQKSLIFNIKTPNLITCGIEKLSDNSWEVNLAKPQHNDIYKILDNQLVYEHSLIMDMGE